MRYDYVSILRGTATPREIHSDLMTSNVNVNYCDSYSVNEVCELHIRCVYTGRRALECEIGEVRLVRDSLLKEIELCKTFWYVYKYK